MSIYGSGGLRTTGRISDPLTAVRCPVLTLQRQRTSRHMALIKRHLNGTPILARAEGFGLAVAITERELLIGRARLFGSRLDRFNLARLVHLRTIRNLNVDLLQVTLSGMPIECVTVMYPPQARASFANVRSLLETHIRCRKLKKRRRSISVAASTLATRPSGPQRTLRLMAPIMPLSPHQRHAGWRRHGSGGLSCLVSALINILSMT